MKLKMWRNGRGGRWTARITWYDGNKIRLACLVGNEEHNFYPTSGDEANRIWELFKTMAKDGESDFLTELVETIESIHD